MILLDRKKSEKIALLEAFIRRSPSDETKFGRIVSNLSKAKSGLVGEERVDREWIDIQVNFPHVLIHGLETENVVGFQHQIDSIFICQYFVFVMEIKNYSGFIEFDEKTHQFIKKNFEGGVEAYSNPIDQVRRHRYFIQSILWSLGFDLPIVCGIIFANPKSILGEILVNDVLVFHVVGLRHKLEMLLKRHVDVKITFEQMMSIGHYLKSMHKNRPWKVTMDQEKLRKGVLCSNCSYCVIMTYHHGRWNCPRCGNRGCIELLEALDDYRLLWGEQISNREFREFVGLTSEKTAFRILKSLNLKSIGANRNKKYIISSDIKNVPN